ncbi:MAG: YlmC/YmxH family sporulation protein [Oscillospiraceae bacterium]|nr:YlmC/YmxH family sporulation protein [Oscillospiraceae bacterium]
MVTRISDLKYKDVVSLKDGTCLGCVSDAEFDCESARLLSIIIYGRYRFFGLLGREEDIVIRWDQIQMIGEDVILVECSAPPRSRGKFFPESFSRG